MLPVSGRPFLEIHSLAILVFYNATPRFLSHVTLGLVSHIFDSSDFSVLLSLIQLPRKCIYNVFLASKKVSNLFQLADKSV
jgi:hypothetical protein